MVRKYRSPNCVSRAETGSVFGSPFCPNISANLDPEPFRQRGSVRQPLVYLLKGHIGEFMFPVKHTAALRNQYPALKTA